MACPRPTGTQRCWGSELALQLKPPSQPPLPPPLDLEGLRFAVLLLGTLWERVSSAGRDTERKQEASSDLWTRLPSDWGDLGRRT